MTRRLTPRELLARRDRPRSSGQPDRSASVRRGLLADTFAALASVLLLGSLGPAIADLDNPLAGSDLYGVYAASSVPWGDTVGGYPFGMNLWPHFQTLDVIPETMKALLFAWTGDRYLPVNIIWLASFPVCAGLVSWLLRRVGAPAPLAVVLALAYTFLPYHWVRGFVHPYLATMWSAVLGTILALLVGSGRVAELWHPRNDKGERHRTKRVLTVAAALIVAWSGVYYAFFTVVMFAVALLWLWTQGASVKALARSAIPLTIVVLGIAVVLGGCVLASRSDPTSGPIAVRNAAQSNTYAGALAFLLVPSPVSEFPGAGAIGGTLDQYLNPSIESTGYSQFGAVTTSLCLAVYLFGGLSQLRRRNRAGWPDYPSPDRPQVVAPEDAARISLGLVTIMLSAVTLLFVPWSLNFLFALWVSPGIRSWDRLLPVILLLVLVGATVVARTWAWLAGGIGWLVAGALLIVVALDGVAPYPSAVRAGLEQGSIQVQAGQAYARRVNHAVPRRCGVLQLPYVPFPEKEIPIGSMDDYEHFLVALTNTDKGWSYGAVKGTQASAWAARLSDHVTAADVEPLAEAGFCGVHVDSQGYVRGGRAPAIVRLRALLGPPVATGARGRWQFYRIPGTVGSPVDIRDRTILSPAARQLFYPR